MRALRVPDFANKSFEGMSRWFNEMALGGLLFHPEDAPESVISGVSGKALFSASECVKLDRILSEMFSMFGDGVCRAAYPIFMRQAGLRVH